MVEDAVPHSADWDIITVSVGTKWGWKCDCGKKSKRVWTLEMDARQDWDQHKAGFATAEQERPAAPKPNRVRSSPRNVDEFRALFVTAILVLLFAVIIIGGFFFEVRR